MRSPWHPAFTDVRREHGFEPLRVEGRIPEDLAGTMFRNGPGLFARFGERYSHWFDGDGLVSALRLRGGRAEGAVRLVKSRGLEEERARKRAYFGAYGSKAPGRWSPFRALRFVREGGKNPANTSILAWDERVFALCEIGRPTEIDPETLETIGEQDLGSILGPFSAHPHRVEETGYVYNIGVRVGRVNAIDLYALRPDGTSGRVAEIPLAHPTMIHDFAVTPRYAVIFAFPLDIRLLRVLFGRASFAGAMEWKPELGTEVIVVPFDAPASPIRFRTDAFWSWHVANAFERDREIVIDLVRHDDFRSSAQWLQGMLEGTPGGEADGALHRVRVDPAKKTVRAERLRERSGEFPRIAPREEGRAHGAVFYSEHSSREAARRGPPDTLVRLDVESGAVDEHRFAAHEMPSEGVFVPRPGGSGTRDGWVLSLVYDARAHASAWTILDARRVADGPIAKAWLDHHVPLGFHGAWLSARG